MSTTAVRAAPAVQEQLLAVQKLDSELARIAAHRRRLSAGTEVGAAEAERRALRIEAADHRGSLEDMRRELGRLETDVRLVEQRLERDRTRLGSTASARDAQGLEAEIASLLRRRSSLEDTELGVMERVEAAETAQAATAEQLTEVEERAARLRTDRDDALAGLAEQQDAVSRDRAALVASLPADLVALYDRQRTRYGVGAALLQGGVVLGIQLTGADLAEVRAAPADAVVVDSESGSILVRTARSGLDAKGAADRA